MASGAITAVVGWHRGHWTLVSMIWRVTPRSCCLRGLLMRVFTCLTRPPRATWMLVRVTLVSVLWLHELWILVPPWMTRFRSPLVSRLVHPRSNPNLARILRLHRHFFAKPKKCYLPALSPLPVLRFRIPLDCWMAYLFSLQRPTTPVVRSSLAVAICHLSRTRCLLPLWTH